jgi:hypothetical protein
VVYAQDDRRKYWLAQVTAANLRVTAEEGERVCPHTDWKFRGPQGNGRGGAGNSKGEPYLEASYFRCPSERLEDDRNFVVEVNNVAASREPFLIPTQILRQVVCSAEEWASYLQHAADSDSDDDAPLAVAAWRDTWRLPQDKHDEIVRRIDNEFKDGLYSLDENVRAGENAREAAPAAAAAAAAQE